MKILLAKKPATPFPSDNAEMPPFIKAAPKSPPISECDELTGIPILAQKKYAQIMAPIRAENTS